MKQLPFEAHAGCLYRLSCPARLCVRPCNDCAAGQICMPKYAACLLRSVCRAYSLRDLACRPPENSQHDSVNLGLEGQQSSHPHWKLHVLASITVI